MIDLKQSDTVKVLSLSYIDYIYLDKHMMYYLGD